MAIAVVHIRFDAEASFRNIVGSSRGDVITGVDGDNRLAGGGDDDHLFGAAGILASTTGRR